MNPVRIIYALLIIVIIAYIGLILFVDMVVKLWDLNPITSIGFVVSVVIAILRGHISLDKMEGNLRILVFIFVGTVLSYAATSLIPNLFGIALTGNFVGAVIIGFVILLIWFRGQEIKGWE